VCDIPSGLRVRGELVPTVATFSLTVALAPTAKGTHMSRFVELLEAQGPLDPPAFRAMAADMLARLGASSGTIEMRFAYFVRKAAPMSGAQSLLDYEVAWRGRDGRRGRLDFLDARHRAGHEPVPVLEGNLGVRRA
jgi:GTP cyclohydrolase FolE2